MTTDTHDAACMCFFCREGDPDGPTPPKPAPTMPDPLDIEGDER